MASQPRQEKGWSALLVRQSVALHALDRVVLQERSARVQPGHGVREVAVVRGGVNVVFFAQFTRSMRFLVF
jgi:hypothetical protein